MLGLEVSISSFGLGRVTSAYHFLRIAHTHYYGSKIEDLEMDFEEGCGISPAESISNLSDNSDTTVSTVSLNESGGGKFFGFYLLGFLASCEQEGEINHFQ